MISPIIVLALSASFAGDFAPTPALAALQLVASQAAAAARFPSCAPAPGYAWCRTNVDAFRRTLTPQADAAFNGALRTFLTRDVLGEMRDRIGADAVCLAHVAALRARVEDPAVDLWKITANPNGLTMVDYSGSRRGITVPLSLSGLMPPGAQAEIERRHNRLVCEPEFIAWFDVNGNFLEANPYLGACHDGDE